MTTDPSTIENFELSIMSMALMLYYESIPEGELNVNFTSCKGCDPCSQLLCGMLWEPSAVQTLNTHSLAAHGRSIGAYNTYIATQWLVQRLPYSLV